MVKKLFLFFILIIFPYYAFSQINIGQRFILTLPNHVSYKKIEDWLKQTKPAGVMIESFHFQNRSKTKELINFLQTTAKKIGIPKLFIAVDWEGGIVSRPNEEGGFVSVPSPKNLCYAGRTHVFLAGKLIGQQLRSIGANIDFAPCLDLFNPKNQILATRPFSSNPEKVAEMGMAFSKGLLSENVLSVIKHFPGLGLATVDTHFATANINVSDKIFNKHSLPFKKCLEEGLPILMPTHAAFSVFENEPTSLSSKAVQWLKDKNNDAIFITDDFCMEAVRNGKNLEDVMFKSLQSGYHLIIFSATADEQIKILSLLQNKIDGLNEKQKEYFEKINEEIKIFKDKKIVNIPNLKFSLNEKKVGKTLAKASINCPTKSINILKDNNLLITVDLPSIRPSEKWFIDHKKSYLAKNLKKRDVKFKEFILNPKDPENLKVLKASLEKSKKDYNNIILQTFFYGNGAWNDTQKQWLSELKDFENKLIIVSLGHPLEEQILAKAKIFNLGSFHKPMINELVKKLLQPKNFTGLDVLVSNPSNFLQGKKFGLLCHNASRTKDGSFLPDVLYEWSLKQKDSTSLCTLFSPEHGLLGSAGAGIRLRRGEHALCHLQGGRFPVRQDLRPRTGRKGPGRGPSGIPRFSGQSPGGVPAGGPPAPRAAGRGPGESPRRQALLHEPEERRGNREVSRALPPVVPCRKP